MDKQNTPDYIKNMSYDDVISELRRPVEMNNKVVQRNAFISGMGTLSMMGIFTFYMFCRQKDTLDQYKDDDNVPIVYKNEEGTIVSKEDVDNETYIVDLDQDNYVTFK